MRIRLSDSANGDVADPCGTSSYGEVEDYLLNVQQGTGVAEMPANAMGSNAEQISIYPNPSKGTVYIQGVHPGQYYLINAAGQLIQVVRLDADHKFQATLQGLPAGMYVLAGQNHFGVVKQKIVIED
jgi:hypothetical protein